MRFVKWRSEMTRYKGLVGSMSYSAANFAVAFYLQKEVSADAFGLFAIIQVVFQFGMSVSNAVFNAPINIEVGEDGVLDEDAFAGFFLANLSLSLILSSIIFAITFWSITDLVSSLTISSFTFFGWLRWFYRSVDLAEGRPEKAFLSDILYSLIVLAGAVTIWFLHLPNLTASLTVLILGSALSGSSFISRRIISIRPRIKSGIERFKQSFRTHGAWALLGVITTEITSNCYPYLITAISGPTAFAPIAVINLFYRPITIVVQSLTQYERPRMRLTYRDGDTNGLLREVRRFRIIAFTSTLLNTFGLLVCLYWIPWMIGGGHYKRFDLVLTSIILSSIYMFRSFRAGDSTALQAMGQFKDLAYISVYASPVSLITAAGVIYMLPQLPPMSLIAILIGEALMCIMIVRSLKRFAKMGNYNGPLVA